MKAVKLNLKERSYNIIIGSNIINRLGKFLRQLKIGPDAYIISNPTVKNKFGRRLAKILRECGFSVRFKLVPDTEKSKSIKISSWIVNDLASYDKNRRLFIIAFGGGVIGDLAGFVASVYKRGIPYIQLPTTLLAQVDSAIGGKTALDLAEAKNLIGAFYQPRLVFSDISFLNTLDKRQLRSGLAEVIKYAIIKDRQLFLYLEKNYRNILKTKKSALEYIVQRSSRIKANIVQRDEREEKGLRTVLNFGHTAGHALEAACGYKTYSHGEAIAIGILLASDISRMLNLIDTPLFKRIENLIKAVGLPLKIKAGTLKDIIEAHYRDKKFRGARNRFVLIEGIGRTKVVENIPLTLIKEALERRF